MEPYPEVTTKKVEDITVVEAAQGSVIYGCKVILIESVKQLVAEARVIRAAFTP